MFGKHRCANLVTPGLSQKDLAFGSATRPAFLWIHSLTVTWAPDCPLFLPSRPVFVLTCAHSSWQPKLRSNNKQQPLANPNRQPNLKLVHLGRGMGQYGLEWCRTSSQFMTWGHAMMSRPHITQCINMFNRSLYSLLSIAWTIVDSCQSPPHVTWLAGSCQTFWVDIEFAWSY